MNNRKRLIVREIYEAGHILSGQIFLSIRAGKPEKPGTGTRISGILNSAGRAFSIALSREVRLTAAIVDTAA